MTKEEQRISALEKENVELRKALLDERITGLTAQIKLGEALLNQAKMERADLK
jgi:hypothetical protein